MKRYRIIADAMFRAEDIDHAVRVLRKCLLDQYRERKATVNPKIEKSLLETGNIQVFAIDL